jgi:hypothetical protein
MTRTGYSYVLALFSLLGSPLFGQGFGPCGGNICSPATAFVGIGTTNPMTPLEVNSSTAASLRGVLSAQFTNDTNGGEVNVEKARMLTDGSLIPVQPMDNVGSLNAWAYDGSNYLLSARIRFAVDNTVYTGVTPTNIEFIVNSGEAMRVTSAGNVGIGTTTVPYPLTVNGTIQANELMVVGSSTADYVFDSTYRLAPLTEVAAYVQEYKHLPEIPSAAEVTEKGVGVGQMQSKLLAKIEELTLYMIQAEKDNQGLKDRLQRLEQEVVASRR